MLVETTVRFRSRRDPLPYDMSERGGPTGVSYSFDALDIDDAKVKVKCSKEQWDSLASVGRDTPIAVRLDVANPKVDGADGIRVQTPVAAGAKT